MATLRMFDGVFRRFNKSEYVAVGIPWKYITKLHSCISYRFVRASVTFLFIFRSILVLTYSNQSFVRFGCAVSHLLRNFSNETCGQCQACLTHLHAVNCSVPICTLAADVLGLRICVIISDNDVRTFKRYALKSLCCNQVYRTCQ